ncbi:MAG: hypothetical protein ABIR14_00290 [Candidatus Paceibacterota bacterium]
MKIKNIILIIIAIILLAYLAVKTYNSREVTQPLGSNPPNSAENAPVGSIHNLPVPEAVSKSRSALATRLSIPESKILILEALDKDWPDACLGIKKPGTMCAQVITPGYNILMQANGKEYRYRTNLSGSVIVAEN